MKMKLKELKELIKECLVEESTEVRSDPRTGRPIKTSSPKEDKVILRKGTDGQMYTEYPVWDAIVKLKEGTTVTFPGVVSYTGNYSFGEEVSPIIYMISDGGDRGSWTDKTGKGRVKPLISSTHLNSLIELARGTYYSKDTQKEYDKIKTVTGGKVTEEGTMSKNLKY